MVPPRPKKEYPYMNEAAVHQRQECHGVEVDVAKASAEETLLMELANPGSLFYQIPGDERGHGRGQHKSYSNQSFLALVEPFKQAYRDIPAGPGRNKRKRAFQEKVVAVVTLHLGLRFPNGLGTLALLEKVRQALARPPIPEWKRSGAASLTPSIKTNALEKHAFPVDSAPSFIFRHLVFRCRRAYQNSRAEAERASIVTGLLETIKDMGYQWTTEDYKGSTKSAEEAKCRRILVKKLSLVHESELNENDVLAVLRNRPSESKYYGMHVDFRQLVVNFKNEIRQKFGEIDEQHVEVLIVNKVETFLSQLSPPGRLLTARENTNNWYDAGAGYLKSMVRDVLQCLLTTDGVGVAFGRTFQVASSNESTSHMSVSYMTSLLSDMSIHPGGEDSTTSDRHS